jgi:hypothetical protein
MSTLIPSITACKFDTTGERRFARLLETKLEDDYRCWYNVPIGPKRLHPDFIVMHPQRGIIILEVKDWRLTTIQSMSHDETVLFKNGVVKKEKNPLEQAREYAIAMVHILQTDPQLIWAEGRYQGKLLFPWAFGVVLTNITRKEYEQTDLPEVIDPRFIMFKDEIAETVDAMAFQEKLWGMFPFNASGMLTMPQLDRVRWHIFPEIRLPYKQANLFDNLENEVNALPDIMRVMDIQQEQLARSLGQGHRVIHGVAGSGKTLILGYRAEHLAKACTRPILILCFNRPLAQKLEYWMDMKGLADKVRVHSFHSWCHEQLTTYKVGVPQNTGSDSAFFDEMVDKVIREVDRKMIPSGQYDAVMIDEGHDFRAEWFKLIVQMVNPQSNSLLVMYDDAQSIYDTRKKGRFSFKGVGIQAQGRTTILRVNYRNTDEILNFAARFTSQLLTQEDADEDSIPRLAPIAAGRHGKKPLLLKLPTIKTEAEEIARQLKEAHQQGMAWKEMAVLYGDDRDRQELYQALVKHNVRFVGKEKISYAAGADKVSFLSFRISKGLEFPLVAIMGGQIVEQAKVDTEAAKRLYVAMTRATDHLIMTVAGDEAE